MVQKLFAFKQHKFNPTKPPSVPEEWVWLKAVIDSVEREQYESDNWIVLTSDDFATYLKNGNKNFDLRVLELVNDAFAGLHPSKVDFRRHLKENIYLQKNVVMLPNGRPQKAVYSYNGKLIAEIEFKFEVNEMNFMIRRVELLSYFKNDGQPSDQWVLADDSYDISNPYHLGEMMKERSEARSLIFEEIKAFLNEVFAAYYVPQGKSYAEILGIAGDLWNKFSTDIDSWINVGSPKFSQNISSDTDFPVLDFQVAAGVTLRAWILSKVQY